jgi:hypothetical protein
VLIPPPQNTCLTSHLGMKVWAAGRPLIIQPHRHWCACCCTGLLWLVHRGQLPVVWLQLSNNAYHTTKP